MSNINYLMENDEEAIRLDLKTDISAVEQQALWAGLKPGMRVADIGCGPGVQTVDLLKISGGRVLALDFLPLMLERTLANAEKAGVSDRLEVVEQDMARIVVKF